MRKKRNNNDGLPSEPILSGMKNRVLHVLARFGPGPQTLRVRLHRWRGVKIGTGVHISSDVLIETAYPHWVSIGNGVQIGVRTTIMAHIHALAPRREKRDGQEYISVRIEDDVAIGMGVIICPNVTIGRGAVVSAGSVVTSSVPPLTMVQGNPARPVAQCGIALTWDTPLKEFLQKLRPIRGADR